MVRAETESGAGTGGQKSKSNLMVSVNYELSPPCGEENEQKWKPCNLSNGNNK
jgi:hypothetical protein